MFDQVPGQIWILVVIAAVAYAPAQYVYRFIAHSPSRRDITQPTEDLSWRTSGQLARSLSILGGLIALTLFVFTPAAVQFARSPRFFLTILSGAGGWLLFTVSTGFVNGKIQPFVRGIERTYERESQPKRFWLSLAWNALLGCGCIWLALTIYREDSDQVIRDQCYDERTVYSPQKVISACNVLIAHRDSSPDHLADFMVERGVAYHRLGNYGLAIADYSKAIRLNSREYIAYFNRALAYQQVGENRLAMADFNESVRLMPNDAPAYLNRGIMFLDAGKLDEALADLTHAHDLRTKNPWALANRGIVYALMKDEARAEEDFNAVRAIDPTNPVMLRGEAFLRKSAGDMSGAVDRLTASMVRDPDNLWALRTRAELYWDLGEEKKSAEDDKRWQVLTTKAHKKAR